ncbi:MAG: FKBP-type peptidyl-prolyl cis-trans isomerase [Treponema sp.]|jgi:FKBP-type peptidyl-prolyl cis-trans isomerase|nr:FKBP-type peptidyl-prolyl cis-trans isomerase [Treponema sp.]
MKKSTRENFSQNPVSENLRFDEKDRYRLGKNRLNPVFPFKSKVTFSKFDTFKKRLAVFFIFAALLNACKNEEKSGPAETAGEQTAVPEAGILDNDASYAFGMAFALEFKDIGLKFDYDNFLAGFRDSLEGKETRLTEEEAGERIQTAYSAALNVRTESLMQQEKEFLAVNTKKQGVVTTKSGLQYEVIAEGKGSKPLATDTVRVNYEGTLLNGTVFDSSYVRGEPAEFTLDRVIEGWLEGIQLMNVGGAYRFYIPSNLAYGERGSGSLIPPYSTLIFKVELLDIVKN